MLFAFASVVCDYTMAASLSLRHFCLWRDIRRLSARGVNVTGGKSTALGGLHVKSAGTDSLGVLELSCREDDLNRNSDQARQRSVIDDKSKTLAKHSLVSNLLGLLALVALFLFVFLITSFLGGIVYTFLDGPVWVVVVKVGSDLAG